MRDQFLDVGVPHHHDHLIGGKRLWADGSRGGLDFYNRSDASHAHDTP